MNDTSLNGTVYDVSNDCSLNNINNINENTLRYTKLVFLQCSVLEDHQL